MGAPDKCARLIDTLVDIGVNEIACLVDFGVDADSVLESLSRLDQLRARYAPAANTASFAVGSGSGKNVL